MRVVIVMKDKKSTEIINKFRELPQETREEILKKLVSETKKESEKVHTKNEGHQYVKKSQRRIDGFAGPLLLSLITFVYGIIFLVAIN